MLSGVALLPYRSRSKSVSLNTASVAQLFGQCPPGVPPASVCAKGNLLCSLHLTVIPELKHCSAHLVALVENTASSHWRTRSVLCVTSSRLVKISSSGNAQRLLMKEGDIKANNLRNPWRARAVARSEAESHGLSFHELCLSFPAGTSQKCG